ncbi:MAG: PEGA domain-containing protein [Terriglobales bacterium]|jgi:hypothetical protein
MRISTLFFLAAFLVAGVSGKAQTAPASLPSEPGMYVASAHGMVRILGQSVSFQRSGSRGVAVATLGIKAQKENVQLLGAHAQTTVDSNPQFYFIPAKQESEMGVSAGDLIMIRVEVEAERRHFEVGAKGIARESKGVSITHQIQIAASEAQPGVYKVTAATALANGEYALYLNRGERLPAYVYDFSVGSGENVSRTAETAPASATPARTGGADNGKCNLQSVPDGADIAVDGNFGGNTPSALALAAGKHTITVSAKGFRTWEKEITINAGSEITLKATLEKQ